MDISVALKERSYTVTVAAGGLARVGERFALDRRVLVVTDSGVPPVYAETVAAACREPVVVTVPQGEGSKCLSRLEELLKTMLRHGFTRADCVVAVGGGVVGDLAGFAAAVYMRGVDFYNVPTTLLAQVDSSIGGKVAVDLDGIKNSVGAFHQPRAVLVDPSVLSTLPRRQISNGLAEAIKMAVTLDGPLFEELEQSDPYAMLETVIVRSLRAKAAVVAQDEREGGLRRVLNFGHTIGHGVETAAGLSRLLHGECVALGMLPMCGPAVRERLRAVLQKAELPTHLSGDPTPVIAALCHDKKRDAAGFHVVFCREVGTYALETLSEAQLTARVKEAFSA